MVTIRTLGIFQMWTFRISIDYVLITHNHQDHILFGTLLWLQHKIKNIIVPVTHRGLLEGPDLKVMFNNIGFYNVIAIKEMETFRSGDTSIAGLPFTGEHSDLDSSKSCYLVQVGEFKLLFLADSRILNLHYTSRSINIPVT